MRRLLSILMGLFIAAPALAPQKAEADIRNPWFRDYSPPYYYSDRYSRKPEHGYSGWHPGPYRLFCDYDRIPVRKCDRNGRCRVVKWRIREYCY